MSLIKTNIENIKKEIKNVLKIQGRQDEVTLIGVSKGIDIERIKEALEGGLNNLGENYWQEAKPKIESLSATSLQGRQTGINWHFVGHLQRNKVKFVVGNFKLIQSVDSYELAEEIGRQARNKGIVQDILIQVNTSKEESKFGVGYEKVQNLIKKISDNPNLNIKGLMTIAPFMEPNKESRERVRFCFRQLKNLFEEIKRDITYINMEYLSMGMSDDYLIALEEGSNMLRIGRKIFGERIKRG